MTIQTSETELVEGRRQTGVDFLPTPATPDRGAIDRGAPLHTNH